MEDGGDDQRITMVSTKTPIKVLENAGSKLNLEI